MTPAIKVLTAAKIPHRVLPYEHDPSAKSYGLEAAAALGVEGDLVFKTLVVSLDGKSLGVGIVPVTTKLNLKAVGAALGAKKAAMADPALVERTTGYVLGGGSPLGQKKLLPTAIDESAELYDEILVSGGRRGLDIALAPDQLIRLLSAVIADIASH